MSGTAPGQLQVCALPVQVSCRLSSGVSASPETPSGAVLYSSASGQPPSGRKATVMQLQMSLTAAVPVLIQL